MNVTVIQKQDRAALIEWVGPTGPCRSIIPLALLEVTGPKTAEVADPEQGIPYGFPWAELWSPVATPAALQEALYRAGLWTLADLRARPSQGMGALQAMYGLDLAGLLRRAETYTNQLTAEEEP